MEEYDIKWKDHTVEAFTQLNRLRRSEQFADVLLYCDEQIFKAHKVILASCSVFFEKLFSKIPDSSFREAVVALGEIRYQILKRTLDFIYLGEVQVPTAELDEFMKCSEFLGIRGLKPQGSLETEAVTRPAEPKKVTRGRPPSANQPQASPPDPIDPIVKEEDEPEPAEEVSNEAGKRKRSVASPFVANVAKKPKIVEADKLKRIMPSGISIEASVRKVTRNPLASGVPSSPSTSAQYEVSYFQYSEIHAYFDLFSILGGISSVH
jgi:hypothetical protein